MKKVSKILIILLAFIFITNVNAFEVGQKYCNNVKYYPNDSYYIYTKSQMGDIGKYQTQIYNVSDYSPGCSGDSDNHDNWSIYCLDPNVAAPTYLQVDRVLMDTSGYLAQDAGTLYAVKFNDFSENTDSVKFQKGVAVRMLYNGVYGRSINRDNKYTSHQYEVEDFKVATEIAIKKYCKDDGTTSLASGTAVDLSNGTYGIHLDGNNAYGVLSHFCEGYNAYLNYDKNNSTIPNVSAVVKSSKQTKDGVNFVIAFQIQNFNLTAGAVDTRSIKIDGIYPTAPVGNPTFVGASFTFDANFATGDGAVDYDESFYNTLASASNLLDVPEIKEKMDEKGNLTFYIAVSLPVENDGDDCSGYAEFKYTYDHPLSLNGAELRGDTGARDVSDFQRFIIFAPESNKSTKLDPCNISCPTSENLIPLVCEDLDEPDENGNVVYSFREAYFKDIKSYDVQKCIMGKTDEALNSYKYIDEDSAGILTNNPYCSVYCKEDYVFNVPYKRVVANGRYFQIDMDIVGAQTCYSSKINQKDINDLLVELQDELVTAYNEYAFYKFLYDHEPTEFSDGSKYRAECEQVTSCNSTSYSCDCETDPDTGVESCDTCYSKTEETTTAKKYYGYIELGEVFIEVIKSGTSDNPEFNVTTTNIFKPEGSNLTVVEDGGTYKVLFGGDINNNSVNSSGSYGNVTPVASYGDSRYDVIFTGYDPRPKIIKKTISEDNPSGKSECSSQSLVSDYDETTSTCLDSDFSGENKFEFTSAKDDYDNLKEIFGTLKNDAAERVAQILEDMKYDVHAFDSCAGTNNIKLSDKYETKSTEWNTEYKFDPIIKYSYDEPNIADYSPDEKWIKLAANIGADVMTSSDLMIHAEYCNPNTVSEEAADENKCTSTKTVYELDYENGGFTENELATKTFCTGDIDSQYVCQSGSITYDQVATDVKTVRILDFIVSGHDVTKNDKTNYYLTNVHYVQTNATAEAKFDTPRVYYQGSPTGVVTISQNKPVENSENPENYELVPGLPVSIQTPLGVYYYKLIFENIGTFYTSGTLGRIYGSGFSVSDVRNSKGTTGEDELENNAYACTYEVGNTCVDSSGNSHTNLECDKNENWEDCKVRLCQDGAAGKKCVQTAEHGYCICSGITYDESCDCKGTTKDARTKVLNEVCGTDSEDCDNNYNCCPYCTIECIGSCIFESKDIEDYNGESMLDFRAVNISSINPNDRELGYNWNAGEKNVDGYYNWNTGSVTNVMVAEKAGITINEIESRANITDISTASEDQLKALSEYSLVVTLTPTIISDIKGYNKEALSSGSYNNQTLSCYDYTLSYDYDTCTNGGFTWVPDDPIKHPTGDGSCVMANIMCYSSFIDWLKDKYDSNVETNHRPSPISVDETTMDLKPFVGVSDKYSYNELPVTSAQVVNVQDYWAIIRYSTLDVNGDKVPDIGPSWK